MADDCADLSDDNAYLSLAASLTATEVEFNDSNAGFNTSDNEPLITMMAATQSLPTDTEFAESDNEPLITLMTAAQPPKPTDTEFAASDNEPLITWVTAAQPPMPTDTEFVTSDNEPLSQYQQPRGNSSDGDPTYCPNLEELSGVQEPGRKRQRLSRKDRDLRKAVAESSKEFERLSNDITVHQRRIDNLLLANGLQRMEVAADGNCFFEACSVLLSVSASDIRKCLCDYLHDNIKLFSNFMAFPSGLDRDVAFMQNVTELRQAGKWSNQAADMLPMALATWTNRIVRLYTSDANRPVEDVHPVGDANDQASENRECPILLALLKYPNAPHYNPCVALQRQTNVSSPLTSTPVQHSPPVLDTAKVRLC